MIISPQKLGVNNTFRILTSFILIPILSFTVSEKTLSASENKTTVEGIGISASIAATFLVSAVRECRIVGVPDLDQCAKINSPLLADTTAQMAADLAISFRSDYLKECKAKFADEYCFKLLKRAVEIEFRKPIAVDQ